ncbi:hypothetical protein CDL12_07844 [Handroanthus impetiginosus]|uniref:Uncharacterized protein n=1 Tax=Handroanthus impetiginosus TaxID=429701 RepID=A0A2G9HPV2_9LAMI|nr:hypothetical protein CDL12_07844 [Handroanthus impetiginosus]
MIKVSRVDAKSCLEGLPWVQVICNKGEVDQPCWLACQQRHGLTVKAYCDNPDPDFPRYFCYCTWPC